MIEKTIHDLAVTYASSKLSEYEIDKREAPLCGNTEMSSEEVLYLKAAYDFAVKNLSELKSIERNISSIESILNRQQY